MVTLTNPYNPLYACFVTAEILFLARFLPDGAATPSLHRFQALDGLRGFAALFVFIHHASIWWGYQRDGVWAVPPSNLYTQFGQGAVTTFFLLTSFLFWTKMSQPGRARDWSLFFVNRVARIVPLYLVATLLLFVVSYIVSPIKKPLETVSLTDAWHILLFTLGGLPDLFGVRHTFVIDAGVTWTLPYEWAFYLALPALTVILRGPFRSYWAAALWIVVLEKLATSYLGWRMLLIFPFGILVSALVASPKMRRLQALARARWGGLLILAISGWIIWRYQTAYCNGALVGYALIIFLVASGNSLFGLLTSQAARKLGQISYSVYLLQGFLLFGVFSWFSHYGAPARRAPFFHWLLVDWCALALVLVSTISYRYIESPAIQKGRAWGEALRVRHWDGLTKRQAQRGEG